MLLLISEQSVPLECLLDLHYLRIGDVHVHPQVQREDFLVRHERRMQFLHAFLLDEVVREVDMGEGTLFLEAEAESQSEGRLVIEIVRGQVQVRHAAM